MFLINALAFLELFSKKKTIVQSSLRSHRVKKVFQSSRNDGSIVHGYKSWKKVFCVLSLPRQQVTANVC